MEAPIVIAYLIGAVISFLVLWLIIRSAVKDALRQHQEWMESRDATPTATVSAAPRTPAPKGSKLEEIRKGLDEN